MPPPLSVSGAGRGDPGRVRVLQFVGIEHPFHIGLFATARGVGPPVRGPLLADTRFTPQTARLGIKTQGKETQPLSLPRSPRQKVCGGSLELRFRCSPCHPGPEIHLAEPPPCRVRSPCVLLRREALQTALRMRAVPHRVQAASRAL